MLGLSDDGGFWAIGLRDADPYAVFDGIEMSTTVRCDPVRPAADLISRCSSFRRCVTSTNLLMRSVAHRHPQLRFSRRYQGMVAECHEQPVDRLFDGLYSGSTVRSRSTAIAGSGLVLDGSRWSSPADLIDQMVVSRCEPPVIDVGCGPGRMVRALQHSGQAVLGIDISNVAVEMGSGGGGQVLRRHLADRCRARVVGALRCFWMANVGIGGDVVMLLRRCRDLVGPGGLIICEADPDPDRDEAYRWCVGQQISVPPCRGRASAGAHFSGWPPRST